MEALWTDMRFALRMLVKNRGFATIAIITLALGIGANTAIFSVVNATMLEPLPFPNRDRLVMVWEQNSRGGRERNVVNPGNFIRWRERARSFRNIALLYKSEMNVTGTGDPQRVAVGMVSPALFSITGIRPVVGRTFTPEEEKPGSDGVALLSESYWRSRYGSADDVVNRDIMLDGHPLRIVGVIPDSAQFAIWGGLVDDPAPVWMPLALSPSDRDAGGRFANVMGELAPGVTVAQADAEMKSIARQLEAERPLRDTGWTAKVEGLREYMLADLRPALLSLLAGVGLVLLMAIVNVANLLFVRATSRQREIAVRYALGITQRRLVQQLITESVLLAGIAGIAGVALAQVGLRLLIAMAPAQLPAVSAISIDGRVLGFSAALALLSGMIFGLIPAFRLSGGSLAEALKSESHTSPGRSRARIRKILAGSEAALALILLVGAGLVIRSFINLLHVQTGFDAENVITMQISLPDSKYGEPQRQAAFFQELVERIGGLPGVKAAAANSFMPLTSVGSATDFTIDERPQPRPGEEPGAEVRSITADYFRAMSVPLLSGRSFSTEDKPEDAVKKVVINETMAKTYWPGQNPLGRRITMEWGKDLHAEIIGVVNDVKQVSLEDAPKSQIYWYTPQFPYSAMAVVVRSVGDPAELVPSLRAQVAAMDRDLPVAKIQTATQILASATQSRRFTMSLMAVFAGLALLLAAVGLYGVISYSVSQRTQEIGVRMALGAGVSNVLMMIVREGLMVTAAGVGAGMVAAVVLARFMQSLLFGIGTHDAVTFGGVAAILLSVGVLASLVPAWRASRVDPLIALRHE